MSPSLPILLGQVLCLGQVILTQEGALPRPSISAEPGSVILWGQPVTIVCRGPAEAETFRLLWVDDSNYTDQKILPQHPPHETEARFPITRVSDDTARHYFCRYHNSSSWSERSEFLELVVTGALETSAPSLAGNSQTSPGASTPRGSAGEWAVGGPSALPCFQEALMKSAPCPQKLAPRQCPPPRITRW
ncbi:leukocyte-associated immunoglobulin-like receptor 2 isoform X5 [Equus asinus]|uniref:leukocyte-associated immunoglobulin-like receptor 2 isoform X5 n=1 Tax=Equus asinus TaxID=9793 RepID=UPI0038F72EAD